MKKYYCKTKMATWSLTRGIKARCHIRADLQNLCNKTFVSFISCIFMIQYNTKLHVKQKFFCETLYACFVFYGLFHIVVLLTTFWVCGMVPEYVYTNSSDCMASVPNKDMMLKFNLFVFIWLLCCLFNHLLSLVWLLNSIKSVLTQTYYIENTEFNIICQTTCEQLSKPTVVQVPPYYF